MFLTLTRVPGGLSSYRVLSLNHICYGNKPLVAFGPTVQLLARVCGVFVRYFESTAGYKVTKARACLQLTKGQIND